MKRAKYEKELQRLQVRLCHLQRWVKEKGVRAIIVFEGRDGAGKGGTIRALTERVSPRVFRVVALPAPSDREKSQLYFQRYFQHFPAAPPTAHRDSHAGVPDAFFTRRSRGLEGPAGKHGPARNHRHVHQ